MSIRTPERQHQMEHAHPELLPEDCWQCQREKAKCRSKRRFDRDAAASEAQAKNVATDWRFMLVIYPCPWCQTHHLTKAKPGTSRWSRAEKRRRRWAASEEGRRRAARAALTERGPRTLGMSDAL